jgi:RNA:NAD 2'-phosphotransferase (TPT1/KptA family)
MAASAYPHTPVVATAALQQGSLERHQANMQSNLYAASSSKKAQKKKKDPVSAGLSWTLRHNLNLKRDVHFFSSLTDVAVSLRCTPDDIRSFMIVNATSEKQRYMLSGDKIRAFQGHSHQVLEIVAKDHGMTVQEVSASLLIPITIANLAEVAIQRDDGVWVVRHMTNPDAAKIIAVDGLSRMSRVHIHMIKQNESDNKDMLYKHRSEATVRVWVKIEDALNAKIFFGYSDNGCVLSCGNSEGIISIEFLIFD